jgi:predicted nucleic acid-binding protein
MGKEKNTTFKMRIVIDTNIAFSAILNTNSLIARVLLYPKSNLNFYSTDLLKFEIEEHKDKLIRISGLTEPELEKTISIIKYKIRFIDANLIPSNVFKKVSHLLEDIDIDDTEFVALTNHIHGRLWSGDKILLRGLIQKGWNKFISTNELYDLINRK